MKPGPDTHSVSSVYDLIHTCLSASVRPSTCLQHFTGPVSTLYGSASLVRPSSSSNLGEHKESPISNVINTLRIYMHVFAYDLHMRSTVLMCVPMQTRMHVCACVWRALRSVLMSSSVGLHLSLETGSLIKPRGVDCPANRLQRFACPCTLPDLEVMDPKLYLTFEYFHACVSSTVLSEPSPQAF